METKIFAKDQIDEAVELLREGELVAFPTETVYGLGAIATKEKSVKNVYKAKGRPSDNPLILISSFTREEKIINGISFNTSSDFTSFVSL